MKTILLVDDEKLFLSSLSEGLTKLFPQVNIVTAQNGLEAIKILDAQDVILIITDLQMPVMSGFELLECLMNDYREISIIVMTAYGNIEIEDNLSNCGSIIYLEKPIDFQALAEHIQAIVAPTAKGHIKGIDLPNILQLLYLEHKTCTLTVYSKSRVGYLYFIDGELIDAEFDLFKAENAAYEILKWVKPEIEIESISSKTIRNIKLPLDHILLEAAKKQDEHRRDTGSFRRSALDLPIANLNSSLQDFRKSEPKNTEGKINLLSNDDNPLELDFNSSTFDKNNINDISLLEIDKNLSLDKNLSENTLQNYTAAINISSNNRQTISLEQFVNIWSKNAVLIVEKSALAFIKNISKNNTIILQGTNDHIEILSEQITKVLDIVLYLVENSSQGSFEYVSNLFGLTFVWNLDSKYIVVIIDIFVDNDNNSFIWFRRYKSFLEKNFSLG
ncbi:MAG: response regulator [Acidobacteria bacterium]|nr:response regulator [Acidobacteriota bacterium]